MQTTNNTYRIALILVVAIFLSSCAAMLGPDLSRISLGMSKAEVQVALKLKPHAIVVADRDEENRVVEIHEYLKPVDSLTTDRYWLYYKDNRLEKWERMPRQHDRKGPRPAAHR